MSAHSLQRLLEGVRSDLADQLIRHAMAFSGTVHAAFNVLFAAIPQLPQSLLAITAVRQRDAGRSLCRRAGEAAGGWRLRAQVWGWDSVSAGSCATPLALVTRRVLQCQLEHLQQSYEAAVACGESLPTPAGEVNKWLRREEPEETLVNLQAVCAPDVFLSLFFRALGAFRFVALHREATEATEAFPQRQGSRCGRREGTEVVRVGSFVEYLMVGEETGEVSLARVALQQGGSRITALRSGGHDVESGEGGGVRSEEGEVDGMMDGASQQESGQQGVNQQGFNQPIHQQSNYPFDNQLPVNQSIHQSNSQQINQPINQSINQSINPPINQSITPPINQSINPPINQSINQAINHQPTNQPINPPSLATRLLSHIPRSLDGTMTQTPHAGLYMQLTVWSAPLALNHSSTSPRNTARSLRHTLVALAKQARIEWAFHPCMTQSLRGLSRAVASQADFRHAPRG